MGNLRSWGESFLASGITAFLAMIDRAIDELIESKVPPPFKACLVLLHINRKRKTPQELGRRRIKKGNFQRSRHEGLRLYDAIRSDDFRRMFRMDRESFDYVLGQIAPLLEKD